MTKSKNRPQPPVPESWENPKPIATPKTSKSRTAVQEEVLSLIDDLQSRLAILNNRVNAGVEIGSILTVETADLNFALGKYQHSLESKNPEVITEPN